MNHASCTTSCATWITIRERLRQRYLTPFILIFLLFSFGCSSTGNFFEAAAPEDMNLNMPPETLVKKGMDEYNRGKYFVALEYFNKILDSHRFTPQAVLAELKVADCKFYMEKYAEAYIYYEKFEEMHPTNEAIPYVMYQKGLSHYKRLDRVDRDISGATKAIERFQLLLKAYPDSPYAKDAKEKIVTAKEFLANHEFSVAEFYLRTDQPKQALIRLNYLITMFPETKIVDEATRLLEETRQEVGEIATKEADKND